MGKKPRKITEKQWREAVDAYELGTHNAAQIARELGVTGSAVSRQLKRRGACKACRVGETVVALETKLQTKAQRRAHHRSLSQAAAMERFMLINAMVDDMVKSVLALADGADVATAASKVAELREALRR